MSYKKDIENTMKAVFAGAGKWDIPKLDSVDIDISEWQRQTGGIVVGFNYCKSYEARNLDSADVGIHFFLDDYQFDRLWNRPAEYLDLLRKFKFVCSPDFSLFTDHPKAVQIWNHYKKHWLGAYWRSLGLMVIPTICWSDASSFEWCFDGEPVGSVVAVSTKGTQKDTKARELFYAGYCQMLKRLTPKTVLLFGKNPGALDGNVVEMGYEFRDAFAARINKKR